MCIKDKLTSDCPCCGKLDIYVQDAGGLLIAICKNPRCSVKIGASTEKDLIKAWNGARSIKEEMPVLNRFVSNKNKEGVT